MAALAARMRYRFVNMRAWFPVAFTLFLGWGMSLGCAVGVDDPEAAPAGEAGSAGEAQAGSGGDGGSLGGSGGAGGSGGSGGGETAGNGGDGGASGTGGSGGTGGTGGGTGGTGGTGGGTDCNSPNLCVAAESLGEICGDKGSDELQETGTTSKWLKVRVTEEDGSPIGAKLKVTASLMPPQGSNFDLFLFVNQNSDVDTECSWVAGSSTSGGISQTETASAEWGEGTVANGADDHRWVTIEVRHISGTCEASLPWTLVVKGN